MKEVSLSKLAEITGGELYGEDATVNSVSTDTRHLVEGDLFIALQGERFDGNSFLAQAVHAGAAAAVVSEKAIGAGLSQIVVSNTLLALGAISAWHRQQLTLPIVGLTGSVGKTSCKELLANILRSNASVYATEGNLNNEIGVPLTLLALNAAHDFAVVEMGAAKAGDIAYLSQLVRPSVALVTTVAAAHLEGFGSMQTIANTKAEIYQGLDSQGIAVVSLDNEYTQAMTQDLKGQRVVSFSCSDLSANVCAGEIVQEAANDGMPPCYAFQLETPTDEVRIALGVPGEFMVRNALAAAACAVALGVGINAIQQGLESFSGFQQRMLTQEGLDNSVLIDDSYNANPASMRAAIDVLADMNGYRVLLMGVMAELGSDSKQLHTEIGRYASEKGIDKLIAVGELTRPAVVEFGENAVTCADHQECIDLCVAVLATRQQSNDGQVFFLAKGSRSAKMEKVVAGLALLEGAS